MKKKLFRGIALVLACCLLSNVATLNAEETVGEQEEQIIEGSGKLDRDNTSEAATREDKDVEDADSEEFADENVEDKKEIEESNQENTDISSLKINNQETNLDAQPSAAPQNVKITGSVEVAGEDKDKGIFTVRAYDFSDIESICDIRFAVWSEEGGQDDLTWNIVESSLDASFYSDVKLSDHNYTLGKYIVHAYALLESGGQVWVGETEYEIVVESSELKITEGTDSGEYFFTLNDLVVPAGEEAVLFAVWSENGGQDDMVWYDARKLKKGSYEYDWSVQNHRALGKYNVHVYVRTKGNTMKGIGAYEFNIDAPKVAEIEISDRNVERGTFSARVEGVSNADLVKEIMIPVWSNSNGQDDLVWYAAQKDLDGTYELTVDVKNHKYSDGSYNIHAYVTDITGYQYFVGSTECSMDIEKGSLQIENIGDARYRIVLSDFVIPAGASEVLFPVWSENGGQDDLVWYTAGKNGEGDYVCTISLDDHRGLGRYNVHAYAKKQNGEQIPLLISGFETEVPIVNTFEVEKVDEEAGCFTVKVSDIENEDLVKNIKIPVWSKNDQSDLIWYNARKNLAGEYIIDVHIKDHRYNIGEYSIHCYVEDITGMLNGIGSRSCDMSAKVEAIEAEDIDDSEETFEINISGVNVPAGERELRVAVWGDKDGQNDLTWHTLSRQSNGNYSLVVEVRDHCELGLYNVHVYCVTKGGGMFGLGTTTFNVSNVPLFSNVTISEINGNKGTFRVTISGLLASSGIQKVEIPMWCSDNQNDIYWYTASRLSEGSYTTTMNVVNHRHHFGDYKVHVYVTMGNGVRVCVSSSNIQNISPNNYLYNEYISDTQRRVWLLGVDGELVQFPTWSDEQGQDDIVWYDGTNNGNGTWSALVDSANHSNGGNYTTHAYVTKSGVRQSVGSTNYSLIKIPTDLEMMRLKANSYSSTTGYIALVNRTTHKVGIFQGWQGNWNCIQYWDCSDGKASTPTVEGVFRVGSRGYYFYSGDAICYWWTQFYGDYLFHSVLYNRYNGSLMDGRLGMGLSHGCVRLNINNAKWIYDTIPSGTTVVVYH